jgi:potassium efflux system protein
MVVALVLGMLTASLAVFAWGQSAVVSDRGSATSDRSAPAPVSDTRAGASVPVAAESARTPDADRPASAEPLKEAGPTQEATLTLEWITARRTSLLAYKESLAKSPLPKAAADEIMSLIDLHLVALQQLEEAIKRRQSLETRLAELAQPSNDDLGPAAVVGDGPLRPTADELKRLETALGDVQSELKEMQAAVQNAQARQKEIPDELDRANREKAGLTLRIDELSKGASPSPRDKAELDLLGARRQLAATLTTALQLEKEWLVKRIPVLESRGAAYRDRARALAKTVDEIRQTMSAQLARETQELAAEQKKVESKIQRTSRGLDRYLLERAQEGLAIQQATKRYRQASTEVQREVDRQSALIQDLRERESRLKKIAEGETAGDLVPMLFQGFFQRVQRDRRYFPHADTQRRALELSTANVQRMELEDKLLDFDDETSVQREQVLRLVSDDETAYVEAEITRARGQEKDLLREQLVELDQLIGHLSSLGEQYHRYQQTLDDVYRFVFAHMFWVQDEPVFGSTVLERSRRAVGTTVSRLHTWLWSELPRRLRGRIAGDPVFLAGLLGALLLPLVAFRARRVLCRRLQALLAESGRQASGRQGLAVAVLTVAQSLVWPIVCWLLGGLVAALWTDVRGGLNERETLVGLLRASALLVWLGTLRLALFRGRGLGDMYLDLTADSRRALRRFSGALLWMCWTFLLPALWLRWSPGAGVVAADSLALSRVWFTLFEVLLVAVVAVNLRRASRLMCSLADPKHQGWLIRQWTWVYTALVAYLSGIAVLDVLGYRHASRFIWLKTGHSALVILVVWGVYLVAAQLFHLLIRGQIRDRLLGNGETAGNENLTAMWRRLSRMRTWARAGLVACALIALAHVWSLDRQTFASLDTVRLLTLSDGDPVRNVGPSYFTLGDAVTLLSAVLAMWFAMRHMMGFFQVVVFPRVQWDEGLRFAVVTMTRYAVVSIGAVVCLRAVHVHWAAVQWVLAATSVGLGFGLQEFVSNFMSGIILLVERPIQVGDLIRVGTQEGKVERISIRATTIRNWDHQTVIVPNKELITQQLTNWTQGDTVLRLGFPIGVAYGTDPRLVEHTLLEAAKHANVLSEPAPLAAFMGFGDSSLTWQLWVHVDNPANLLPTRDHINRRIQQLFAERGISIPYPQRELRILSDSAADRRRNEPLTPFAAAG